MHRRVGQFYYHGYRQYERALAEFERALQLQTERVHCAGVFGLCPSPAGQWERCLDELKDLSNRIAQRRDRGKFRQYFSSNTAGMWKERLRAINRAGMPLD